MLTQSQITSKLMSMQNELIAMAAKATNTSPSEWVCRDALPLTDFNFNSERWVNQTLFAALNTFQRDWLFQLPIDKYVAFYGVVQNPVNPTIYGIRFRQGNAGATTIDTIHFRKILEEDNVIGYFDRIIYRAQSTIWIDLIADALTPAFSEEFEILAIVCEKYGNVVSGDKSIV